MLDHQHQNHSINLCQVFMFTCMQKNQVQYQFEVIFNIYLQVKHQLHPSRLPLGLMFT